MATRNFKSNITKTVRAEFMRQWAGDDMAYVFDTETKDYVCNAHIEKARLMGKLL